MFHLVDQNTGNLLEAFRTQSNQKQIREPKALSSGQIVPKKSKRRKVRNAMIKIYVNGALILIASALVFVAYRLAVIPEIFPPQVQANNNQTQTQTVQSNGKDYQGAANFAITFGYYWIKGELDNAKKYAAHKFVFPEEVMKPVAQEVIWYRTWEVNPIDENKVNVVVQAAVQSSANNDQSTDGEQNNQQAQVVYLSVPIIIEDGKYGVYDIPTYLPTPGKATYQEEKIEAAPIAPDEQNVIRNRVKLFLDEYFGGEAEKLSIYYKDGRPRATLDHAKLIGIHEYLINQIEKDNANKVRVDVIANTEVNGVELQQKFKIFMVKESKEWKIEKTNPDLPISNVIKKDE